jgi:hypothetical protein
LEYFDEFTELNDVLRTIYSAEAKDFPKVLDALTQAAARCVAGANHAGAFSQSSRRVAATLATVGALAWSNAVRGQQFAAALGSRDTIGQARAS